MKWLSILKNKAGKFTLGIPQMVGIAGAGMLLTYGAFQADNAMDQKGPVRSLTSISDTQNYSGMDRTSTGQLTSMKIKDGLNQVATREERERMEGGRSSNDFGLSGVDGIEGRMSAGSYGPAAPTGASDGLGMGANAAVETGNTYIAASRASAGSGVAGLNAGGNGNGGTSGANGAQASSGSSLGSASIARASGSAFNAAAGAVAGGKMGGSASNGRSGATHGGASGDGYQFSGAMPGSSSAVASLADGGRAHGSAASGFMASSRRGSAGRATRSNSQGDLKDISKRSADAARNQHRATNEGSRAFLASSQNSGGMTIEGGVETESTGSADFEAPATNSLKGLGDWQKKAEDKDKEQQKARERLQWMMIAMIAGTFIAMRLGFSLIQKGKKAGLFGWSFIAWGWTVLGIGMAYAAVVMGFAIDYMTKFNGLFMPITALVLGAAAVTALAITGAKAMAAIGQSAAELEKNKFAAFTKDAFKQVAMTGATTGASMVMEAGNNADSKAMENPHNK